MDTRRVSGVGQIPISKTDIIHLFNYDTQDVDGTVLRSTFGNQVLTRLYKNQSMMMSLSKYPLSCMTNLVVSFLWCQYLLS